MFSKKISRNVASGLVTFALLGLGACNKSGASSEYLIAQDLPIGSKDAKVTVVEYASTMCPHCAGFNSVVMPVIKKNYIDTGKVIYAFREFPTPPVDLATAGHLLHRCVAEDKREAVLTTLFEQQSQIYVKAQSGAGAMALADIATSVGMSDADFRACMSDREKIKTLATIQEYGSEHDKVNSTPSLFVNGKKVPDPIGHEWEPEDLTKVIDAELAKNAKK